MNQERIRKIFIIIVLAVVTGTAGTLVALSFVSTSRIADMVNVPAWLLLALVEVPFITLLAIRAFQRAYQLDLPRWLDIGYYCSFGIVTSVNVYGLSLSAATLGIIVGLSVSGMMLLMDKLLVWLIIHSHKPHIKSTKEILREIQRERQDKLARAAQSIEDDKAARQILYMKEKAKQPDIAWIKQARKDEAKLKKAIGEGLPELLQRVLEIEKQPPQFVEAEPVETIVKSSESVTSTESTEIIPLPIRQIGQIGFTAETVRAKKEEISPKHLFKPNTDARQQAVAVANELMEELGRLPKQKELQERGLTEYYAKFARNEIKKIQG